MEMERGLIKTSAGYIHYRATGQGRPIILMHHNLDSSAMYPELMEVLGRELRVVAFDWPSHGMSDPIPGQPAISDYARFVTEVMDGLRIEKASFLGEAFGATVQMIIGNEYPERVEKLVMVNCPFYFDRENAQNRHSYLNSEAHPTDATGFPLTRTLEYTLEKDSLHCPMHPTQSWMDRMNMAMVETGRNRFQLSVTTEELDRAAEMERLQCPVLLVWGEHFHYLQFRDELTRRIKNHQVLVIKGGRMSIAWEFPEELGQATLKFLSS
ncbi:alpha/beta fold hydrolase [Chloroflexota bacterium]